IDGIVRDTDLASHVQAIFAPGRQTANKIDASFFIGPCFAGGMLDDLQREIGQLFPFVGGASTRWDELSYGQWDAAEVPKVKDLQKRLTNLQAQQKTLEGTVKTDGDKLKTLRSGLKKKPPTATKADVKATKTTLDRDREQLAGIVTQVTR